MAVLHKGDYFVVEHHRAFGYVQLTRTDSPFSGLDHVRVALKRCESVLLGVDATRTGILLDWRRAALSTDPRLHRELVEGTDAFASRFARRALLIATPLGKLQLNRIARDESSIAPAVFDRMEEAIAFVTFRTLGLEKAR